MKLIGVIGSGVMGRGVAHALAGSGHRVVLIDTNPDQITAALRQIRRDVRLVALMRAGADDRPPAPADELLDRITGATELAALAAADFVIENVTESWAIKHEVHRALDGLDMPAVPIAINTSAIPISRFAALHREPGRVVGMHFMNPVPLMPVIEVIRGAATGGATLEAARRLTEQMGKRAIVVNDSPGFVTNRVMMLTVNEAIAVLDEEVSTAEDIDRLFQTCFNHRMGPLATADLIGLDTVLYSLEVLHGELGHDKFRPCPLLARLVAQGKLGRKTGAGFFSYAPTPLASRGSLRTTDHEDPK
jgi:3-hydroxybutyryl-CoA dehydrogenase